jgi:hypothetical protein
MTDRAFVATEILDDYFGVRDSNEILGEKIADSYDFAMERYADYGFPESERKAFVLAQIDNTIFNYGGGTALHVAIARRILEAWGHAGVLS